MYYLTYKRTVNKTTATSAASAPSIDYLIQNFHRLNQTPIYPLDPIARYTTTTRIVAQISQHMIDTYTPPAVRAKLINLWERSKHLMQDDMSIHYHAFLTPKKTGGMRQIMAPNPELKAYLRELVDIIQDDLHVLNHDAAYAYTKGRSPIDAAKIHQQNESYWFLKIDLKDFFPSCSYEKVNETLKTIFPLSCLYETPETKEALEGMLKMCFVDNGLPQGTPASPLLTNLLMLPTDYIIKNTFRDFNKNAFVYTRYADDIILSSKHGFKWREVVSELERILTAENLTINKDKTRYGNRNGRNWNLGLMLNKDNNITVGHRRKKEIKAMVHNFLNDYHRGEPWSKQDTQVFLGQLSYVTQIEPDYFNQLIKLANVGRQHDLRKASLIILRS